MENQEKLLSAQSVLNQKSSNITIVKTNSAIDILKTLKLDDECLIVSYLYIPFSHNHISETFIVQEFGVSVFNMLDTLNQLHKINYNNEKEEAENIRKMYFAITKDIRIIFIKLAFVLAEMRNQEMYTSEELKQKARVNLDLFAPLAARLGASSIKSELENTAFKILHPLKYREIENLVQNKFNKAQEIISSITNILQGMLKELNIPGEIMGRRKHTYSIYKKLTTKHTGIDDIYDLVALRVLVDNLPECYAMLGKIHGQFTPISGRFKDYIATPKSNGYQSLHTTILYNSLPVEIQIRTFDMHRSAEFGYAAHWMYKEKRTKQDSLDTKLGWIRQILEENENLTSEDIIGSLKVDIYDGEIFVQSPLGKVVHLPEGSTTIDFAYSIHSEVGNKMIGAKINNKIQPITTVLHNGDIVEIITSIHSKGPSRDWLKAAKTISAKHKIRQFFKKEMKDENIKVGKSMLELAFKNQNISFAEICESEEFNKMLSHHSFNNTNELFASVGGGSTNASKIVNYIVQLRKKKLKEEQKKNNFQLNNNVEHAVEVEGGENMLICMANCCHPEPGDEIIGFISRGRGLIIHKLSCGHVKFYDDNRLLKATWKNIKK